MFFKKLRKDICFLERGLFATRAYQMRLEDRVATLQRDVNRLYSVLNHYVDFSKSPTVEVFDLGKGVLRRLDQDFKIISKDMEIENGKEED